MRSCVRSDSDAVSPVIATILLVAITVILAAVLYLMISGMFRPVGNGPQVMGVLIQKTTDGKNWSLTIASTPIGLTPSEVRLIIFSPSGTTNLSKTFNTLAWPSDGAVYIGSGSTIAATDRLLVDAIRYPIHYGVQISDASTILFSGELT